MVNGNGRVNTAALTEEGTDSAAGTLGCDEDDINVCWYINLSPVLEDWRETVGEVEGLCQVSFVRNFNSADSFYLALQLRLDRGPCLALGGIAEQIHDDGTA